MNDADRRAVLRGLLAARRPLVAVNINDQQDIAAAIEAAQRARSPIILMASVRAIEHAGLSTIVQLVRSRTEHAPVWLQLDHASDMTLIAQCIASGFDIVMADFATEPLHDNVRKVREVVGLAQSAGVLVEGEVGALPEDGDAVLTSPSEAGAFVAETGVDLLAVSVGNRHGFAREKPPIDCELVRAIASATRAPLVLHGGDYCSHDAITGAVRAGMTKVNFGPELREAYCVALRTAVERCDWHAPDHRPLLQAARVAVRDAIVRRLADVTTSDDAA